MRFPAFRTKPVVGAIAVAATLAALGYWGFAEFKTRQLRNEIVASVNDAGLRMQTSLASDAAIDPASLRGLHAHAEAVGAHFRKLRATEVEAISDLASAADDYLLTAREILLRRAASEAHRLEWSASIEALRAHMRADDRTGAWVSEAVRAKNRVDAAYRDYSRALNALETLLGTLPASAQKMTQYIDAPLLPGAALVAKAREDARVAARHAASEMEKVRLTRYQ